MSTRWIYSLPLRLRSLFRGRRVEQELDDEFRFHLEHLIEEQVARGAAPDDARVMALRMMDGVDQQKERCRDARRVRVVEDAIHDLRYAVRMMRRSSGFTAIAVLSLTLGIGANTAMFQLVDAIGLRPLPVERPGELAEVRIAGGNGGFGLSENSNSQMTNPLWEALRDHQEAFSGIFAWGDTNAVVGRGADTRSVRLLWVSGDMFPVLGVRAALGRLFTGRDDYRGCGTQGVVLSDGFWRSYMGGSESAVGAPLHILDRPVPVIGVTPPAFFGLEVGREFDIALPICAAGAFPSGNSLDRRHVFWLTVMGRLQPGWTIARAAAHVGAISPGLLEATLPPGYDPAGVARYRSFRLTALSAARGVSEWRTRYERALWWLLATTGMVLLIACANISSLLLARATTREREMAIRTAIGATRARLMAQMLIEGALLAGVGAAGGAALAAVISRAMVAALSTERDPLLLALGVDWRVVAFTAVVAAAACLAFAAVPAIRSSHTAPVAAMQMRTSGTVGRRGYFQRGMVIAQIALSLVLLVGALLFVRSFRNLASVDTGLREDGVMFANIARFAAQRPTPEQILALEQSVLEQIRSTPYVESAAATTQFPLNGSSWTQGILVAEPTGPSRRSSKFTYVSAGYFSSLGIPVRAGRDIADLDTSSSRKVAVVNETFVRRYASGANPIGLVVRTVAEPGYPETTYEVIGVVGDTRYASVRDEMPPIAYVPITQHPSLRPWPGLVIRTSTSPTDVIPEIKRRIGLMDSSIVTGFTVFKTQMRDRMVRERTMAWLAGGFGVLALVLSTIGLYGVVAYFATARKHEIGVRRAIGAGRVAIVRLVLAETAIILALGVPIGAFAARIAAVGADSLLFGLSATDPLTVAGCGGLLAAAAFAASAIPAVRASRADPMDALRCE